MKPHPTKSKPRIAKPSPRQPGKGERVMWYYRITDKCYPESWSKDGDGPVLVLDLSPTARERRVEVIARALADAHGETYEGGHHGYRSDARAVLLALGDTPAEGRGK